MDIQFNDKNKKIVSMIGFEVYEEQELQKAFSTALREIRSYSKFSLKALSERTGMPIATISAYENGTRVPSFIQAIKLCAFFGSQVEDFLAYGVNESIHYGEDIFSNYDSVRESREKILQ